MITRHGLNEERDKHRILFHGGDVPDGEQVMEPDKFSVFAPGSSGSSAAS
ncbi:hypothetical protein [Streptomyces sp. NBC_01800]|nr:hypothetical protein [Streptomyces sp. NBC_01800]WSA73175.1 hypothetical protein OIE65_43685 [Streptomyces sp. NBC_01800]